MRTQPFFFWLLFARTSVEQDRDRNQIGKPDQALKVGWGRPEADCASEEDVYSGVFRNDSRYVVGNALQEWEPAELFELVNAVGEDSGRDNDQEPAGDGEERAEV